LAADTETGFGEGTIMTPEILQQLEVDGRHSLKEHVRKALDVAGAPWFEDDASGWVSPVTDAGLIFVDKLTREWRYAQYLYCSSTTGPTNDEDCARALFYNDLRTWLTEWQVESTHIDRVLRMLDGQLQRAHAHSNRAVVKPVADLPAASAIARDEHVREPITFTSVSRGRNKRAPMTPETAQIDAFIERIYQEKRVKITRKDIHKVAGYDDRTEFQRYQSGRPTVTSKANFERVLAMSSDEFLKVLLSKKRPKPMMQKVSP
jgi:hypothetical protein